MDAMFLSNEEKSINNLGFPLLERFGSECIRSHQQRLSGVALLAKRIDESEGRGDGRFTREGLQHYIPFM
jgi:hypothetical protein